MIPRHTSDEYELDDYIYSNHPSTRVQTVGTEPLWRRIVMWLKSYLPSGGGNGSDCLNATFEGRGQS